MTLNIATMEENLKRPIFICAEPEKPYFSTSHCCLGISVGQPYYEGESLQHMLHLIGKEFKSCTIAVGDTLQRHTSSLFGKKNHDDHEYYYQQALQEGDDWLARNKRYFDEVAISYDVRRWDEWLFTETYLTEYQRVQQAYNNDSHFKQAVDASAHDFVRRVKNRSADGQVDEVACFNKSLAYLLEECTIMMLMWQKEDYNYIAYPSKILDAVAATYQKFVAPNEQNLVKWLRIRFRRYSKETVMRIDAASQRRMEEQAQR